jgi:hypothetical protein
MAQLQLAAMVETEQPPPFLERLQLMLAVAVAVHMAALQVLAVLAVAATEAAVAPKQLMELEILVAVVAVVVTILRLIQVAATAAPALLSCAIPAPALFPTPAAA